MTHYLNFTALNETLYFILNSQDLIVDFHHALNQNAPNCLKLFEEIVYSFLEDIQKYKKDIRRIEISYKKYGKLLKNFEIKILFFLIKINLKVKEKRMMK